jgi:hypothetical protein
MVFITILQLSFVLFAGGSGRGNRRQRRGEDVVHPLKVSLEDLYNGTSKKLSLSRNVLCSKCKGWVLLCHSIQLLKWCPEVHPQFVCMSLPQLWCFLSASQHHEWVFQPLLEMWLKFRTQILHNVLPKQILCTYPHPPLGADEVSGESWQLVTVIHDEGDWLSGTLWVRLIWLWQHSFLSC